MRRVAAGFLASGLILFASGWFELTGLWSLVAAVACLTSGALLLAIAMEEADLSAVGHLSPVSAPLETVGHAPVPDTAA